MRDKTLSEAELSDLGRRATASRHWNWIPGMKALSTCGRLSKGWLLPYNSGLFLCIDGVEEKQTFYPNECIPDLRDPGTLAHLHCLAEEAWGLPNAIELHFSNDEDLWYASWSGSTHGGDCGEGTSKAEALVSALESIK